MVGSCTKILSRDFAQAEFISRIKVVNVLNQLKGEEYSEQALISTQVLNFTAVLSQRKVCFLQLLNPSLQQLSGVSFHQLYFSKKRRVAVIPTFNKNRNTDVKQK